MESCVGSTNKKIKWIDAVRGCVIMLMIIGHSGPPASVLKYIFGFHMAFFFILSGYLFNVEKWQKLGFKEFLVNKFKAYMVPYFIWAFVNLIINMPKDYIQCGGNGFFTLTLSRVGWIVYSIGDAGKVPNCVPLWFLPAMFMSNIYLYLIFKMSNQIKVLLFAGGFFLNMALMVIHAPSLPWHIDVAMIGAFFMYAGYLIKSKGLLTKTISMTSVGVLFLIASYVIMENGNVSFDLRTFPNMHSVILGGIIMSFVIMYVGCRTDLKNSILELYGRNTIIMMALNYAVIYYSRLLWNKIPFISNIEYNWIVNSIVNLVVLLCIAYIWELLVKKVPVLKIAVGKK